MPTPRKEDSHEPSPPYFLGFPSRSLRSDICATQQLARQGACAIPFFESHHAVDQGVAIPLGLLDDSPLAARKVILIHGRIRQEPQFVQIRQPGPINDGAIANDEVIFSHTTLLCESGVDWQGLQQWPSLNRLCSLLFRECGYPVALHG